jgi:enamine deaminase RidA (YjgF/YER057c/UK114 family)
MRQAVTTHLPSEDAPLEWAVTADGVLYTAQIPIRVDGSIESGDIEKQADLTFSNLKKTIEAAGGNMGDVTQVLVYLTGKEHFAKMNEVYRRYFSKPFPNRATVIVAGLMVPGAVIEIVAYAHLGKR